MHDTSQLGRRIAGPHSGYFHRWGEIGQPKHQQSEHPVALPAQAWIENELAEKITSPMVVVPPIQRTEAGANSQVKIQGLPELAQLPQDRESLFYFNLREIPPRSDKPNTLQIALQTRVKLFYRPAAIAPRAGVNEAPRRKTHPHPPARPLLGEQPNALLRHADRRSAQPQGRRSSRLQATDDRTQRPTRFGR